MKCRLSLDTTGAVAASQFLNFSDNDHVVVTLDGVLQSGNCNGKRSSCLSDIGEVEPLCILEDAIPVEAAVRSFLDGRMSTVVDTNRTTLRSALLVGVHAITTQGVRSRLADCVGNAS